MTLGNLNEKFDTASAVSRQEWVQDPLPFEDDGKSESVVVGIDPSPTSEFLTVFVVALDHELKPTIFLKARDWDGRRIDMHRDATQFDVDVVNLYLQKYRGQ